MYHIERGSLLAHEQHLLALKERLSDEVCDGLTLAGAGWPLDYEVLPGSRSKKCCKRRRVGVAHCKALRGTNLIEGVLRPDGRGFPERSETGDAYEP